MTRYLASLMMGFLLLIAAASASAQVTVYVSVTAPDAVGGRLAYSIKEGIRRSTAMQLVDREQDGFVRVNLVTLDPDKTSPGIRTIYSVVWTTETFHKIPVTMYLTNRVGICGSDHVLQCAESLVAGTDEQVSFVRLAVQTMLESTKN